MSSKKTQLLFCLFICLNVQAQTDELAGHYFVGNMRLWWMREKIEFFPDSTFEYSIVGEGWEEHNGTYKIVQDTVYLNYYPKYDTTYQDSDTYVMRNDSMIRVIVRSHKITDIDSTSFRPKMFFYRQNRLDVPEDHYGMRTAKTYSKEMARFNQKLRKKYHLDKDNYKRYFWRIDKPMRIDFTKRKR